MIPWILQSYCSIHLAFMTRLMLTGFTALLLVFLASPALIAYLQRRQLGQSVREDGPSSHLVKSGTPTMGGVLILLGIFFSVGLWADWCNHYVWLLMIALFGFGLIGGIDDYLKISKKNSQGLTAKQKYIAQSLIAMLLASLLYWGIGPGHYGSIWIPYLKVMLPNIGMAWLVLVYFVIVGSSNAVNLTDGLDGLAMFPILLVAFALGVFACLSGKPALAEIFVLPSLPGVNELALVSAAIFGAGVAFLWFNAYPAKVFMGDVGSLALGAMLGLLAVSVQQTLIFFLMSGIFVIETLSVMIQVISFKTRGKRVFKMAPIHHHFEISGWSEPTVMVRFWMITIVLVCLGLSSIIIGR